LWTSQPGSLLLWVFLLSVYAAVVLRSGRGKLERATPYAIAVLGLIAGFFISLIVLFEQPFATLSPAPVEGSGLNPLLRNELNAIHPPLLYSGYVGFAIPFAFAIGALLTRETGPEWIRATRRYALAAWSFLAAGLLVGSYWGYTELGWGGYWGSDPVENAALLPWLTGTAFIHSVMVQERRGMLRIWNVSLIIATFVLALTGTFLVRSGILESVHAFGASTLGVPFLMFIAAVVLGSVTLVLRRIPELRSTGRLESLLSREAIFLFNNLALVGLAFVILWGTFFPLISEAVTGRKASVGPPWFAEYTTPIALVLALLAGLGPVFAWSRMSAGALRRALLVPITGAVVGAGGLVALTPAERRPVALAMFVLAAFIVLVVVQEYSRGGAVVRSMHALGWPRALLRLVVINRRRYGGYIAHVGIAVLFLGAAASSAFAERQDARLTPGQTTKVGAYSVTYREPTATLFDDPARTGAAITLGAILDVRKGTRHFTLRPPSQLLPVARRGRPRFHRALLRWRIDDRGRPGYLNVRDKQDDVARRYGVTGIPETFFITASGDVVGHVIGALSAEQARSGIAAARRGRVIRTIDGGRRLPARE
jgi:cytochrome c-type biogenesis protein CcmF